MFSFDPLQTVDVTVTRTRVKGKDIALFSPSKEGHINCREGGKRAGGSMPHSSCSDDPPSRTKFDCRDICVTFAALLVFSTRRQMTLGKSLKAVRP